MDEYVDAFNGGLNSTPPVYTPIACGETVCGETGNFIRQGVQNRDTDWYLISLSAPTDVTWTVTSNFSAAITTVDISVPGGDVVGDFVTGVGTLTVTNCLPAGDWALFVSTSGFAGVPCGSEYRGAVTCVPCTPPPTGACCEADGTCSDDVEEADCLNAGGLAWFEDDVCSLVVCPEPPAVCGPDAGSCYISNGSPGCNDVECCEAVCALDPFCCDVTWDGLCASQALDICEAPALACCFTDGSCQELMGDDCTAAGGTVQGPGSSCATITCEVACCFDEGSCQDLTGDDCAAAGGAGQGPGSSCATITCEVACCFGDGSCQDLTGNDCTAAGGTGHGPGSSCATLTCPPPPSSPNDVCDDAFFIGDLPTTISGTTVGQGSDIAPFCGTNNADGGGLWYTLTGTGGQILVTTCENQGVGGTADYDSKIRVYCQGCDVLTCVAGNDNEPGCNLQSTVIFCSQEGAEYLVLVHGIGTAEGNFTLAVVDQGSCSGAVECIVPCLADLSGNGMVDAADLLLLLAVWGPCADPPAECPEDLSGNGEVDFADILEVIAAWGPCP
ncbi:MAG: hypothetical protein ACYTGP_08340 [Planctomycetota bacterium]